MFEGRWQSAAGRARQRAATFYRGRSPIGALVGGLVLLLLMALIAIPMLIFVVLMLLAGGVATLARATMRIFDRAHAPNGVLDGRKNVRVRAPSSNEPSP